MSNCPPVKDIRMFDKIGIEFVSPQNAGSTMQGAASSWSRRGLDAYNALWTKGLVIFLDVIERVQAAVSASSALEARAVENFKALQLRVRDGLVTEEDYETLIKPLNLTVLHEKKQASFLEVSTTRLMTPRAK
eukprot:264591-Pleurochrysis_carterae.AAC.1